MATNDILNDPRFEGIKRFESKIWLSSPTMHGDEQKWVDEAIRTNWVSTVGEVRKWSTQSREDAPWYQHEEIGYNYRMSNIIAGIVRGQLPYLDEHIAQKKAIWERYEKGLADLPIKMNPWDKEKSVPNFWLSCMIIDSDVMAPMVRGEQEVLYKHEKGKSSPTEILEALAAFNIEGRPIWKPMHMQPIYRNHAFITAIGNGRGRSNAYISGTSKDVGADIFQRGLCLPSDNKATGEDGLPVPPYALYNIGGGQPENLLDYVSTLQEELVRAGVLPSDYDFEGHRELVGMQPGDVPVTYADSKGLEEDYGFVPKIGIREGLRKFAEWYKEYNRLG